MAEEPMRRKNPTELRADAARRDIYNRHGISEEGPDGSPVHPAAALQQMMKRAEEEGLSPRGAWANPEQRAKARYDYTVQRGTPDNAEDRWDRSKYLMDPHTAEYHSKYGRDISFLHGLLEAEQPATVDDSYHYGGASGPAYGRDYQKEHRASALEQALARWDRSHGPLHRTGAFTGNTADYDTMGGDIADLIANRDNAGSQWLTTSEVGPVGDTGRMYTSGEADGYGDAYATAMAKKTFEDRFRLDNPSQSPILNMPSSASPQQMAARIEELRKLKELAMNPPGGAALTRHASPIVRDIVDGLYSLPDWSFWLSLGQGALAGTGAKAMGRAALKDAATDAAATTALSAATSPEQRTLFQYVFGDGKSAETRTPEQVYESRKARQTMQDMLDSERQQGNSTFLGVSEADREMYKRLLRERRVSPAPPRGW